MYKYEYSIFLEIGSKINFIIIFNNFFSRELLQNLIDIDLSNEIFPHRTARIIKVAGHTVRALRTSFVGEMGWELHIPWQSCIPVYNALWEEGLKFGLRQAGYRALYSLSSEKGSIMIFLQIPRVVRIFKTIKGEII